MDGVLTDMNLYLSKISGFSEKRIYEDKSLREEILYTHYGTKLFEELPPSRIEEMKKLIKDLKDAGHQIEILTSYGVRDSSDMGIQAHTGKQLWLQKHYGELFKNGVISRFNGVTNCEQKALYARKESVLIDDHPKNIEEFCSAGGRGILYDLRKTTAEQILDEIRLKSSEVNPEG